jgi:hypothetical protein
MCGFYFAAVVVYGQDIIRVPAGVYRIGGYAENRGIRTMLGAIVNTVAAVKTGALRKVRVAQRTSASSMALKTAQTLKSLDDLPADF